jgi:hypothetical protein
MKVQMVFLWHFKVGPFKWKATIINTDGAGHQWLMPIILATQEIEIRRIEV